MVNHPSQNKVFHSYGESNDPELVEGPEKKWKVYIAQSISTKRYYTGISPNPIKRLEKHNTGDGSKFAIDQGPLALVYVSKVFESKSEARKREIQIKGWRAEKKKWLIEGAIE